MKTFNASDMAHKRTEIFEAARDGGCVIERKNTNGDVKDSFFMMTAEAWISLTSSQQETLNLLEGLK